MTTLTITGKGQVTLKHDLLRHLGVGPGEKVEIDKLPDGQIVVRAATQNGPITNFIGCLSRAGSNQHIGVGCDLHLRFAPSFGRDLLHFLDRELRPCGSR